MRIITFLVGISALAISVYYSYLWFYRSIGMPIWVSVILAAVYCIFASFVFEKAVELFQKSSKELKGIEKLAKGLPIVKAVKRTVFKHRSGTIGLLLGWAVLAGFSMFCTVGGQYESFKEVEEIVEVDTTIMDQSAAIERETRSLVQLQDEEKSLVDRLLGMKNESYFDNYLINEAQDRLDIVRGSINSKLTILDNLNIQQSEYENQENFSFESENFFVYLRAIFSGKDTDLAVKIQFWSSFIPSVLIDVVAPVSLTYFLLGRDKKLKLFEKVQ